MGTETTSKGVRDAYERKGPTRPVRPAPSREPETRLGLPFILFYIFISFTLHERVRDASRALVLLLLFICIFTLLEPETFYFTGLEMRLEPWFYLFYFRDRDTASPSLSSSLFIYFLFTSQGSQGTEMHLAPLFYYFISLIQNVLVAPQMKIF